MSKRIKVNGKGTLSKTPIYYKPMSKQIEQKIEEAKHYPYNGYQGEGYFYKFSMKRLIDLLHSYADEQKEICAKVAKKNQLGGYIDTDVQNAPYPEINGE